MNKLFLQCILSNPNISKEQRKKEYEYKKYVDTHIENVKKAWGLLKDNNNVRDYLSSEYKSGTYDMRTGKGIVDTITYTVQYLYAIVDMQIENHDASKYTIDEWEGYRKNFYPVDNDEKNDNVRDFKAAVSHHYITNMHHWNWWADTNHKNDMPLNFVIEMCCDWIGMSITNNGNALDWYRNQKDIVLGNKQKKWVENILIRFYG